VGRKKDVRREKAVFVIRKRPWDVHGPTVRPLALPPGTPKDRVQILRKGFADALKDPELLAEAKKANLDINPLDGAELERRIKEIFALDQSLVEKLKETLK
jgi:tripartite-type tricarboxylate transporter receptor subunit TctC